MTNETTTSTPAAAPLPHVLDVAEAAAFLRVDPKTVRALLRSGRLKGGRVGRHWRVARASVLVLLGDAPPPPPLPDYVAERRRPGRPRKIRRRPAVVPAAPDAV